MCECYYFFILGYSLQNRPMKIFKYYALTAFIILLCSCNNTQVKKSTDTSENKMSLGEQPIFKVSKSLDSMVIDGKMNEAS